MWNLKELKEAFYQNKINKVDYIKEMHKIHSVLFEYSEIIKETDILKIEIVENSVVMTLKNSDIKIYVDKNDQRVIPIEILNFNYYEAKEFEWIYHLIKKNLKEKFNFFDIGANIGWYSIKIAKSFPDSTIYAFEPVPLTFYKFQKNIEINSLKNIETFNFGFSNKSGKAVFYYNKDDSGSASLANISGKENIEKIQSHITTIDDFIKEKSIKIDFIKCDVEGAEIAVFEGGINTIKKDKPIIFTEMLRKWSAKFNYNPNKIIKLFGDIGYKCYRIKEANLIELEELTEDTIEKNFFFLHAKIHKIY